MRLQPLISVIVPIYNVAKYLPKCIDSLLRQTYKNLEIILIDDGSTDNSGKICDEYSKKDKRIKVIHKQNGGVCSARNQGLDIAKGNYIAFVDPDDYVLPDMYKTLLNILQKENANIAVCDMADIDIDGRLNKGLFPVNVNFIYTEYIDWLKDFIIYGNLQIVCNKLFEKNILIGHRFDTNLVRAEDVNFLLDIIKNSCRIVLCPQVFYCYVKRNTSAMRQYQIKYFESEYIVWKRLYTIGNTLPSIGETFNIISTGIYQQFTERAYKLTLLIILLDKVNEYKTRLEELKSFFSIHLHKSKLLSKQIVRIWAYLFGNYPNFIIKILRWPLVRQLAYYYIIHR